MLTKDLIKKLSKLQDEGYINFRTSQSEVIDFVENEMNYIVFQDGETTKYTSCRLACSKTWNQVKNLKPKNKVSDLDKAYFIENNLRQSWFNFTCFQRLGLIFMTPEDYRVYKFHKEKQEKDESN